MNRSTLSCLTLLLLALTVLLLSTGCGTGGRATSSLAEQQQKIFDSVQERLDRQAPKIDQATQTLGDLGADYAEQAFQLERAVAKARQLDAMRAPWENPDAISSESRRAIILYHLYAVEQAEQKALEAKQAERRAAAAEVSRAYSGLQDLVLEAQDQLAIILEFFTQPKSARALGYTRTFLDEVTAFREGLEASENPRLVEAAAKVKEAEERVREVDDRANEALQIFIDSKELADE